MSAASLSLFLCTLDTLRIEVTKLHIELLSVLLVRNIWAVYHQVRLKKYVYHQRRRFLSHNRHLRLYLKWTWSPCMFAALLSKHLYLLQVKTLFPSPKTNTVRSFQSISTSFYGSALLSLSRYGMKVSKMPILANYVWGDSVSLHLWIHQMKNRSAQPMPGGSLSLSVLSKSPTQAADVCRASFSLQHKSLQNVKTKLWCLARFDLPNIPIISKEVNHHDPCLAGLCLLLGFVCKHWELSRAIEYIHQQLL